MGVAIYIYIYIENCEQCGGELLVYEDNKLHDITAECLRCGMNYANLQLPQEYYDEMTVEGAYEEIDYEDHWKEKGYGVACIVLKDGCVTRERIEFPYEDEHNKKCIVSTQMTVDNWFDYWINNIVGDLAPNTIRNYKERYFFNIQPIIGKLPIADVKPFHCKMVLNKMDADYAGSTIRQTFIAMGTMFKSALMNDLIPKHPMDGVRYTKPVRAVNDIKFLTVEEQELF